MRIIKDPQEMRLFCIKSKCRGKTIAFVPTMGYLHEGHFSLVEAARKKADVVVVSIFVNPLQFGPHEDFNRYPRDLSRDKKLLKELDVDVLFLPEATELYPSRFRTYVEVEGLSQKLCGRSRPTHFRGVTTVLSKLFNIVTADYAFFGEKDYQQLLIVKQMARDLDFPLEIIPLPTVREFDGLAMSSRNKYLAPRERKQASGLYRALNFAKKEIQGGERNTNKLLLRLRSRLGTIPGLRLDYIAITDPETLEPMKKIRGKALIAVAAYLGKTRLIDNLVVDSK
jgi:pantoate--beta-alanine ligase